MHHDRSQSFSCQLRSVQAVSQKPRKIPKSTRFEDALGELEALVKQLEGGEQALEESLVQFERGVGLARFCQQSLNEAGQKVKILTEVDGEERLDDFDAPEDPGG